MLILSLSPALALCTTDYLRDMITDVLYLIVNKETSVRLRKENHRWLTEDFPRP